MLCLMLASAEKMQKAVQRLQRAARYASTEQFAVRANGQ